MGILVAGPLCALLVASPTTQAHGPETCVKDARAALKAESPRAFGTEAIVEGPKTIEMVEREQFAGIADLEWEEFKRHVRPGDCIIFFRTSPYSWAMSFGSEGYVLVLEGQIVRYLATKFQ
jgi:hypothetical protein